MSEPIADAPRRGFLRRHWGKVTVASIILVPLVGFTLWTVSALGYAYSSGERVGYVQKLAQKGWLCKTWEGELAMSNVPNQIPEKFEFSVRGDSIVSLINAAAGNRVALTYEQHVGVPTSCFGETEYFVTAVRVLH